VLRILDPAGRGPSIPHNWEFGTAANNIQLSTRDEWASVLAGCAVLIAGSILVVVFNPRPSVERLPFGMAGVLSLALAASPISWSHYQLLQYPGLTMLFHEFFRRRAWTSLFLAVLGALMIYQIPVAVLTQYYLRYGRWTAESPATLYIWTNVTPAACLLLFGLHMHVYKK
jgi:hypothetical protein